MGKYKKLPDNYFKFVNPVIISLVAVGIYLMVVSDASLIVVYFVSGDVHLIIVSKPLIISCYCESA